MLFCIINNESNVFTTQATSILLPSQVSYCHSNTRLSCKAHGLTFPGPHYNLTLWLLQECDRLSSQLAAARAEAEQARESEQQTSSDLQAAAEQAAAAEKEAEAARAEAEEKEQEIKHLQGELEAAKVRRGKRKGWGWG